MDEQFSKLPLRERSAVLVPKNFFVVHLCWVEQLLWIRI